MALVTPRGSSSCPEYVRLFRKYRAWAGFALKAEIDALHAARVLDRTVGNP